MSDNPGNHKFRVIVGDSQQGFVEYAVPSMLRAVYWNAHRANLEVGRNAKAGDPITTIRVENRVRAPKISKLSVS